MHCHCRYVFRQHALRLFILCYGAYVVPQPFVHVGIEHHVGRSACGERLGIVPLVVFGHIRRWHKYRGLAQQFKLADSTGSGACHNEVGGAVGQRHVGDELGEHNVVRTYFGYGFGATLMV